ncbi:hypothetical protein B6S44_21630 [Bosea sp. Tri-44]|nr:hypothetical protein B6S44_21630 [Bosea sp. Tri-44]
MDAALRNGSTKSDLARLAGCSRMQLWRLYTNESVENTPSGLRLRAALEGDEFQRIMVQVIATARRLAASDPKRAYALQGMLQKVTDLMPKAEQ